MSIPAEYDFDLHFQTQLLVYRDICNKDRVSKTDIFISQKWLEVFQKVPAIKKHARNCLMLLMYTQMHDLECLRKPFTDVNNLQRDLELLLLDYDEAIDESESNASNLGGASTRGGGCEMSDNENVGTDSKTNASMVGNGDANKALETNASTSGEGINVSVHGLAEKGNYKLEKAHNMNMTLDTYQYIKKALKQLKNWPDVNWDVGFFTICFQYFMFDNVELSTSLRELDLKFKYYLQNVIEEECDQQEHNVCKEYKEQFDDRCKKRNSEDLEFKRNKLALAKERERLDSFAESLEKREQLLWQHQQQYRVKIETESSDFNGNSKQKIKTENNDFHGNSKQQQQQQDLSYRVTWLHFVVARMEPALNARSRSNDNNKQQKA